MIGFFQDLQPFVDLDARSHSAAARRGWCSCRSPGSSSPRWKAWSTIRSRSTSSASLLWRSLTNSMPIISPLPRTSPMQWVALHHSFKRRSAVFSHARLRSAMYAVLDQIHGRQRGSAGDRVAAVGVAMRALRPGHDLLCAPSSPPAACPKQCLWQRRRYPARRRNARSPTICRCVPCPIALHRQSAGCRAGRTVGAAPGKSPASG